MKIGNNFKPAVAFTILPFVICRFVSAVYYERVMLMFFWMAILCIVIPSIGEFIHDTLSKIGAFLGNWIARIILFFVWIFAVLPTGVLMKIMKRDRLRLKKPDIKSYWVDNRNKNIDYEYQF